MEQGNQLSSLVKYMRNKNGLTQDELAQKAGVGLRFIRDLEQGKQSLRMDKVNQVLALFGYKVSTELTRKPDQWEIIMHHMNHNVNIYLKNGEILHGILLDYQMEEQKVKFWRFISNNNALRFRETKEDSLTRSINHDEILKVENA